MKYLLDTCTISYFVRGESNVVKRIKATSPSLISISAITAMEIEFGLQLNLARARKIESIINLLLEQISLLPFTHEDALAAAAIRANLQKKGKPIGAYDILIAGTAMSRGLVLVTTNTSEFKRVSGLYIEDWK